MARRKENVDAYGKSWRPIDLQNLEKAVKLMERLNYLNDHFANSLSGSAAIWSQINERMEIQDELQKLGIKLTKQQCEEVIKLLKNQTMLNEMLDDNEATQRKMTKLVNQANKGGTSTHLSRGNFGNAVAGAFQQNYATKQYNAHLMSIASSTGKSVSDKSVIAAAEKQTVKDLKLSSGKFGLAADVMQVAANTFSSAVGIVSKLFTSGMNNQYNAYNNTFTDISVRTGMTRSQYMSNQRNAYSTLNARGLGNNIAVSEVQQMWGTMAKQGLNQEQIIANAIDTVLTNKIVPYLDTSSSYFQQLTDQQPMFMKQMRGIGIATEELTGSSVFVTKYLQNMVEQLGPMASLAENQLGVQFAQMSGTYESLRAQGLSEATIGELYKGSAALYNDPYAALKSSNLDLKMAAASGLASGIDFRDASQVTGQYLTSANYVANLMPEGRLSPLYAGMLGTSMSTTASTELNERNLNIVKAIMSGNKVGSSLNTYANIATSRFANDQNQTQKTLQEVTMENISTNVALIYEQIGYWGDVIGSLLKGITSLLVAKLGSGLIKGIASGGLAKGISSGATYLGAGLAGGFAKGAGSAPMAGKLSALSGTGGAIAGGAGVLAGGAIALKGGSQMVNDFKTGNVGAGTAFSGAAVAGGVGGAAGIIALGASNPIGWIGLAVGGAALLGRHLYDLATETGDISDQLKEQSNQVVKTYQEQNNEQVNSLNLFRDQLKNTDDLETQKQMLINAGIATEQELQKEQYNSKEALIALTDQYIMSTKQLNTKGEQLLSDLEGKQNEKQNQVATGMFGLLDKGYGKMSDTEKASAAKFGQEYYQYISGLAANGDKDAIWRLEQWDKMGVNLSDGTFSKADWEAIMTKGDNATNQRLVKQFFSDSSNANRVTNVTADTNVQKSLGLDGAFRRTDYTQAINYLNAALTAPDLDTAKGYLAQAKSLGLTYDMIGTDYQNELQTKWSLNSYRTGLNKVPYDDFPALLHNDEAVLTASTAHELRNLITDYRELSQQNANFEVIVQEQTAALTTKLDQVISAIKAQNGLGGSGRSNSGAILNNMKSISSTKSF